MLYGNQLKFAGNIQFHVTKAVMLYSNCFLTWTKSMIHLKICTHLCGKLEQNESWKLDAVLLYNLYTYVQTTNIRCIQIPLYFCVRKMHIFQTTAIDWFQRDPNDKHKYRTTYDQWNCVRALSQTHTYVNPIAIHSNDSWVF